MSNEYKDWLWDHIQDLAIEQGHIDNILRVEPRDPAIGPPRFIIGTKDGEMVKLVVFYNDNKDEYVYNFSN